MAHLYTELERDANNCEVALFDNVINEDQLEASSFLIVAFPSIGPHARKRRRIFAAADFERVKLSDTRQTSESVRAAVAKDLGVSPKRVEKVLGRPIGQIFEVWQTEVEGTVSRTIILT